MHDPSSYEEACAERERLVIELVRLNQALASLKGMESRYYGDPVERERRRVREDTVRKKQKADLRVGELNKFMRANAPPQIYQPTNVVPIIRRLLGIIDRADISLSELEQDVVNEAAEWVLGREQQNPSKYESKPDDASKPDYAPKPDSAPKLDYGPNPDYAPKPASPAPVPAGPQLRDYLEVPSGNGLVSASAVQSTAVQSRPRTIGSQLTEWRAKTLGTGPTLAKSLARPVPPVLGLAKPAFECQSCGGAAVRFAMCESCTHAIECHGALPNEAANVECSGGCRRARLVLWDGTARQIGYPGRPAAKTESRSSG